MGRRKIEIQPITRKNGLFKKAYELGVLCSVDVAVIIFEERTGQPKLFQYCSSNIDDLVSRHRQHDGERDTRGPADFAGNSSSKTDEGDDEEIDDDDEMAQRRLKRGNDGRLKHGGGLDLPVNNNLAYLRPHHPSQNSALLLQGTGTAAPTSNLPLSSDRISPENSSKKPRIMPGGIRIPSHNRPSDDIAQHPASASSASPGYEYQSSPASSTFRHPPVSSSHQASTPSFITTFDSFNGPHRSQGPPSRAGSGSYTSRSSSVDASIYNASMRQNHSSASGTAPGIFNFLDNDHAHPHANSRGQSSSGDYPGMDWPVHSGNYTSSSEHSSGSGVPHNPTRGRHWLHFLSSDSNVGSAQGNSTNLTSSEGGGRPRVEKERHG
ncbi:mads-box transcription factor [Moniliophthora roreri MCA 2997]|uniref:Mads-box transcription factor n=2 Tax=Moniliophthora roreri TaxID=221103 RepID=V2X3Y8_MONRO|nr:mads-box transcription factor [Moniliophthora roreri MCA 2997]